MGKNIVNLTINPCKMCMPMGAVSAFYGINKCMTLLHGSQGCSTYIRRHMATHYNEPIDIASSSLTEEGTVYGGEKNLIKGLENLIELYSPSVIGVATTCLAETIGEDVPRIIDNFYEKNPDCNVKIINVSSAGYGGTQYEGFFKTLSAIVRSVEMDTSKNNKVNIITPLISPADTRYLKYLLGMFGIDYILLPDISENLDGGYVKKYSKLPDGGTKIEDIAKMAGANITIELSKFADSDTSVGEYLYKEYGVPYIKLPLPIGLRDTDLIVQTLRDISGVKIPRVISKVRERYLDAMIDSHKYNAEGRAIIFGEPDFIYSASRLCCENGIVPVVTATGSKCEAISEAIKQDIEGVAKNVFVDEYKILDNTDFDIIESEGLRLGANIMIGSSDARRIEEKHGITLIRCAFPIHDQIGGQRVRTLGYEGSLELLDRITNAILFKKESTFREKLYDKYYKGNKYTINAKEKTFAEKTKEKTVTHPCYNGCAVKNARMHLPVAPKCNISCNYCVRKFDCPNESRPGVTTKVLSPQQALEKYKVVKEKVPNLSVVGIAGPGDALADWENTRETLSLIKEYDPDVTFCISTNGLMLPMCADELMSLGVTHVTVTCNAVDPKIGSEIYRYVDYMGTRYKGEAAAAILMANQLSGIKMLCEKGVMCKVNIVMLKGINDGHIETVVKKVKELGVFMTNIMPMIPVEGSVFENMPLTNNKELTLLRNKCGESLKQMYHCKQCRADAIGTLESDQSIEFRECGSDKTEEKGEKIRYAVVSKSGILVDQHFGHATEVYIYDYENGGVKFIEKRNCEKYCEGTEHCDDKEDKFAGIFNSISDCNAVLCMRIGDAPSKRLREQGIEVITTYDKIETAIAQSAKDYRRELV